MNNYLRNIRLTKIYNQYNFIHKSSFSTFKSYFKLQSTDPFRIKKIYRSFRKRSRSSIIIKIIYISCIVIIGLIMMPGYNTILQKSLKFNYFKLLDYLFWQYYSYEMNNQNCSIYLEYLFKTLIELNNYQIYDVQNYQPILSRIQLLLKTKAADQINFLKVFSYVSILINKIINFHKDTLKQQAFKQFMHRYLQLYLEYKKNHPTKQRYSDQSLYYSIIIPKMPYIINLLQYLIVYQQQNSIRILTNIEQLIKIQPIFSEQLINNSQILRILIQNLFSQNRNRILKIFEVTSRDKKGCDQMNKKNLITNLSKLQDINQQHKQSIEQILTFCPNQSIKNG